MGFGWLLCSYFILTMMSVGLGEYAFASYIIGGVIALKATVSLKDYCVKFNLALVAAVLYVVLGIYHATVYLDNLFLWGFMPMGDGVNNVLQATGYAIELVFHVFMLLSVMDLTKELEMKKLSGRAVTNLVLVAVWGVGQILLVVIPGAATFQQSVFPKILLLWALVCYLLNSFMLYKCYQNICPAGEEYGREDKPSRFKFVNRMNKKFEEHQAKALQETLDYQAQKQAKKQVL